MSGNYKNVAEAIIPNLIKRNFDAYYCGSREEATELAMSLIDKNGTVSWGGTRTMEEIGIFDRLRAEGYKLIDRSLGRDREEQLDIMRRALTADTFLMSCNAMTEDGILVNIDGNGNRVSALCFGPKTILMVVGMNKVCKDLAEAEDRAHNVAGVKNAKRFGLTRTGCANGRCIDCLSDECICSHIVKTRRCNVKGRIKVILVGEELGF